MIEQHTTPSQEAAVKKETTPAPALSKAEQLKLDIAEKNADAIQRNFSVIPAGSLEKDLALYIAGITDKNGVEMKHKSGGYPSRVLWHTDKFKDLTVQEMAAKLFEDSGTQNAIINLESVLKDKRFALQKAEREFNAEKTTGKPGERDYEFFKKIFDNLTDEVARIEKVAQSVDIRPLLDIAIQTKNSLTPEKAKYFRAKLPDFPNDSELIEKILNAGYSAGSLEAYIEKAEDGTLSRALGEKLGDLRGTSFSPVLERFKEKFEAAA